MKKCKKISQKKKKWEIKVSRKVYLNNNKRRRKIFWAEGVVNWVMNCRQRPTHHHRHRNKVTMKQHKQHNNCKATYNNASVHLSSNHQQHHHKNAPSTIGLFKRHHCRVPLLMIVFIITIEILLLTNVSHCASKTFYMHWNTTNSL